MLSVTVNLGDDALASEYKTTRDICKSIQNLLLQLPSATHGRHIIEERKEIRIWNFSLDGSSHQTGDAAFTPATPHDLNHSIANNDSHNYTTRNTRE